MVALYHPGERDDDDYDNNGDDVDIIKDNSLT